MCDQVLIGGFEKARMPQYKEAQQVILEILKGHPDAEVNTMFTMNNTNMAVSFFKRGRLSRSLWVNILKKGGRIEVKSGYTYCIDELIDAKNTLRRLKNGRCVLPFDNVQDIKTHRDIILAIYDYCERETKGRLFDCCHRYLECSNARQCTHPDEEFALSCSYRRKLKQGIVFFGENRNVD